MEELVGMAVKKALLGFGVYSGVVESYDAEAGYFGVLYKDGDSEEVDLGEMPAILVGPPMRPKKRRRGDEESPHVVVVVEAAVGDGLSNGDGPATPAERSRDEANGEVMAETVEKKRRVNPEPEPESARPLRRSARQAKAAAEMEAAVAAAAAEAAEAVSAAAEAEPAAAAADAAASATPQQSGRKRRRANGSGRYRSVTRDLGDAALDRLPPKPELPPSQALDLDGLPVLDVFQVYSYLR